MAGFCLKAHALLQDSSHQEDCLYKFRTIPSGSEGLALENNHQLFLKNFNDDFVVAILCVKMRRAVIILEHSDDDSKKSTEFRHLFSFSLFV